MDFIKFCFLIQKPSQTDVYSSPNSPQQSDDGYGGRLTPCPSMSPLHKAYVRRGCLI